MAEDIRPCVPGGWGDVVPPDSLLFIVALFELFAQVLEEAFALFVVVVLEALLKGGQRLPLGAGELFGDLHHTLTYWSPRPRPPRYWMPLPRSRKVVPLWVPSGTLYSTLPSTVGTTTDGAQHRLAVGDGHRDPHIVAVPLEHGVRPHGDDDDHVAGGPPLAPASPWPRSAMLWSSPMPAGIFTSSDFFTATLPVPWQWVAGGLDDLALAAAALAGLALLHHHAAHAQVAVHIARGRRSPGRSRGWCPWPRRCRRSPGRCPAW